MSPAIETAWPSLLALLGATVLALLGSALAAVLHHHEPPAEPPPAPGRERPQRRQAP